MKKIVSSWILLTSVVALALSVVAFTQAAEPSTSAATTAAATAKDSSTTNDKAASTVRPALRGERALGPFSIFDANHDGTLSEDEIAQASDVLRKLDKDLDGKVSAAELRPNGGRPPRPERERNRDENDDNAPPPRRNERPATAPKTNTSTAK